MKVKRIKSTLIFREGIDTKYEYDGSHNEYVKRIPFREVDNIHVEYLDEYLHRKELTVISVRKYPSNTFIWINGNKITIANNILRTVLIPMLIGMRVSKKNAFEIQAYLLDELDEVNWVDEDE